MARVAADFRPEQGATKEHTLYGSVIEEQRRSGQKAAATLRARAIPVFQQSPRLSGYVARALPSTPKTAIARRGWVF